MTKREMERYTTHPTNELRLSFEDVLTGDDRTFVLLPDGRAALVTYADDDTETRTPILLVEALRELLAREDAKRQPLIQGIQEGPA